MANPLETSSNPVLDRLIRSIRAVVRSEQKPEAVGERVAQVLQPYLHAPDLLTPAQREPDPNRYRQHILHVEEDGSFSVVALVWLPGQATPIHDHVSWCVVGVHQGSEYETRYTLEHGPAGPHLTEAGRSVNPPGTVCALMPPGDIHRVMNNGSDLAISLHIYGADIGKLGSSILRCYELEVKAS